MSEGLLFDEFFMREVEKGKILVMGHMTKAKGYTDILKSILQQEITVKL